MDHGRIVERGTHGQLLAADGAYAQMWARQQARPDEAPGLAARRSDGRQRGCLNPSLCLWPGSRLTWRHGHQMA